MNFIQKPTNALILQADWEGGMSHVAMDMMGNDVQVTKVILNAADWIYRKRGVPTVSFDRPFEEFEEWLRRYISKNDIDLSLIHI